MKCLSKKGRLPDICKLGPKWVVNFQPKGRIMQKTAKNENFTQ
jgi:hypothetical protein